MLTTLVFFLFSSEKAFPLSSSLANQFRSLVRRAASIAVFNFVVSIMACGVERRTCFKSKRVRTLEQSGACSLPAWSIVHVTVYSKLAYNPSWFYMTIIRGPHPEVVLRMLGTTRRLVDAKFTVLPSWAHYDQV